MKSSTNLLHLSISSAVKLSLDSPPFNKLISAFNSATSFFSRYMIKPGSTYSFLLNKLDILDTLLANLQVLILSYISSLLALIVAIILVLQLPPNESLSTYVIIEFLYGTCILASFCFLFKHTITYSK
jgi:ABC-type phosphate/phosphonate transport system permease subunit